MSSLMRYDPFREMMSLRRAMDRLFDSALFSTGWDLEADSGLGLSLDVVEHEDEYLVKASLPGVKLEDVELTFMDNTLTIKGEIKAEEESKEHRYHLRERRYGSFQRSVTLPSGIDADKIEADYDAGVLTVHLPKLEEVKPKRITIGGSRQPVIEAKTSNGNK